MNELERNRVFIFWVLCGMTLYIAVFMPSGDDTYWHIRVGEWIVHHFEVPRTGLFSQTKENAGWIPHEWLSEVVIYLVYNSLGWPGLVLWAIASITASILIILKYFLERLPPIRALYLVVFSYGLLLGHALPRPHIFVLPIVTLWFVQMLRASEQHRAPSYYNLPLLVLWANLHGSFLISIPYAVFFAVEVAATAATDMDRGRLIKQWAQFIGLSILCLFATPFGLEGVLLPLQLTNQSYALSFISEWVSPNFQQFQFLEVWLLLVIGFGLSQQFKLPLLRLILLLGLIHLSLKHVRYSFDLLSLQSSLLIATPLARHWQYVPEKNSNQLTLLSLLPFTSKGRLLFISICFSTLIYLFGYKTIEFDGDKEIGAVLSELRQFEPLGKVFNAYEMSALLIFQGYKPYIDSRAELYGDDFIKPYREAILLEGGEKKLDALLKEYDPNWTFLKPNTPAIAYFDMHRDWIPVFANNYAVIHARKGRWSEETLHRIPESLKKLFDEHMVLPAENTSQSVSAIKKYQFSLVKP